VTATLVLPLVVAAFWGPWEVAAAFGINVVKMTAILAAVTGVGWIVVRKRSPMAKAVPTLLAGVLVFCASAWEVLPQPVPMPLFNSAIQASIASAEAMERIIDFLCKPA